VANARTDVRALQADAHQRLEGGDYEGALRAYQDALRVDSSNLTLRYHVGVALSHLNRREEAIAAFRWVVDYGAPGSPEARIARQWLSDAGVPVGRPEFSPLPAVERAGAESPAGGLRGRTEWTRLDPKHTIPELQILLDGNEPSTQGRRYWTRVPLNSLYGFSNIKPGRYRLLAQVGMTRLWDLVVTVKEGETAVVDLTPPASVAPPTALLPLSS
jgi:tetratricopeptide (TPR) repeat protein